MKKELHAPPERFVVGFEGRHREFIDSIQLMVSGPVESGAEVSGTKVRIELACGRYPTLDARHNVSVQA
jgi:hypothetical protein